MKIHVDHLLPRLPNQPHHLFLRPAHVAAQKTHGRRLQPIEHVLLRPDAQDLLLFILGPGTYWPPELFALDFYEPGILKLLRELERGLWVYACPSCRLGEAIAPFPEGNPLFRGVRFTMDGQVKFLGFKVATGTEISEGLAKEAGPVLEGKAQHAAVDEVKAAAADFLRGLGRELIRPLGFDIVHLELAVGRHPARLDRGKVDSQHGGRRVFVGEFDGPDSRTRAKIEDGVGRRRDGREVEGAVEGKAPEVMLEV